MMPKPAGQKENLLISDRTGIYHVPLEGIIRFESQGAYSITHLVKGEKYTTCKGLGVISKELSSKDDFFRIHNSHIINLTQIKMYKKTNGVVVMKDGSEIPVSRRRKSGFLKKYIQL